MRRAVILCVFVLLVGTLVPETAAKKSGAKKSAPKKSAEKPPPTTSAPSHQNGTTKEPKTLDEAIGTNVNKSMNENMEKGKGTGCIEECSDEEVKATFNEFKIKYPNREGTQLKEEERLENFNDNLDEVYRLKTTCTLTAEDAQFNMGKYSDLSLDQMVKFLGGAVQENDGIPLQVKGKAAQMIAKAPLKFDWRTKNVVPPIRDQKECGSCYAFATSDLVTIQNNIEQNKHALDGSYASQYLVDCLGAPHALGCAGGRVSALTKFISECGDECMLPLESCYKYLNAEAKCEPKRCRRYGRLDSKATFRVNGSMEILTMASLLRWGPVLTTVELSQAWQLYNNGTIRSYHCGTKTNHAVLIVGYDYTAPVPYYIVRNSWGPDWGEKGYARIEAGTNTCGIAHNVIVGCAKKGCSNLKKNPEYVTLVPNAPN